MSSSSSNPAPRTSFFARHANWLVPVLVVLVGGGVLLLAVFGLPGGSDGGTDDPGSSEGTAPSLYVAAGEVRGTVLADGEPVAGVKVGLYAGEVATNPEVSAVSDASGRFRLVGAVPGREYLLETSGAVPGGGRQGVEWAPVEPLPLKLEASRGLGDVELAVARTNEVSGRLVLGSGEPLPGIDVIAYRRSSEARIEAGATRREEWARATTDAEGRFTLARIPDGEWIVRANETFGFDNATTVGTQAFHAQATLQELTLDTFERVRRRVDEPVVLSGGSRVEVPDLVVSRGRVLMGTVRDADGAPVAGATVQVEGYAEVWVPLRQTQTDADGTYRFIRLKEATVRVSAAHGEATGAHRTVAGAAEPSDVTIGPGDTLTVADVVLDAP